MSTNPNPFGSGAGLQPWQFQPETNGAKGNGRVVGDVVTNSTTTITSATAAFTSADAGKTIMINGANGTGVGPLVTTISSVTNATTAILASAAGITTTGCAAVFGTDDTTAIQAAINAANAYALANNYFAEVLFGSKIYMVAAAPVQLTSPFVQNAQLQVVPSTIAVNGLARKIVLSLKGPGMGRSGQTQYWESVVPNLQGACLVSTQTAPSTKDPTFGNQSVLGGPSAGGAFVGSFANVKVIIDGITVWHPIFTNMYPYDFGFLTSMEWGSFSSQAFAPAANLSGATAAHPYLSDVPPVLTNIGVGCRFPLVGNNDDCVGVSYAAQGIDLGANFGDHFTCDRLATVYVDAGARLELVAGISNLAHTVKIGNWSIEQYNGGLTTNGGGGSYAAIDITMDSETIGGAASPTYDVNDTANILRGVLRLTDAGGRTTRSPVLNGATGLRVVNDLQPRGVMASPPGVPASGSPLTNLQRDAIITLSTGVGVTVSAISMNGVSTGLTMAASSTLVLPLLGCNQTITLTYAGGTPTWSWRTV